MINNTRNKKFILPLVTMKKVFISLIAVFFLIIIFVTPSFAQCSICAKTVQQMGNGPANGFNAGIIYLMAIPYLTIGVIAYNWWKKSN
jgi:hypothetical protein